MKMEILKMLEDANDFVSGQEMCEKLGISRTAVWKHVSKLKEMGFEIESVNRKGYRLLSAADIVIPEAVNRQMNTKWMGKLIYYYEEIDSTNTKLKLLAEQGAEDGTLVIANSQLSGRGRRGRNWSSPKGSSISMSLCLRPTFRPENASRLTLVMAMAVTETIEEITDLQAQIKWPNDIVIHNKKVCGILTEMSMESDSIHYVIIGVGINVNTDSFPDEIKIQASSLKIEGEKSVSRAMIIAKTMEKFEDMYLEFLKTQDLSSIKNKYEAHLVNVGREVRVLEPGNAYTAIAEGIAPTGELIVRKENGDRQLVYAGEVSVRGLYGYV